MVPPDVRDCGCHGRSPGSPCLPVLRRVPGPCRLSPRGSFPCVFVREVGLLSSCRLYWTPPGVRRRLHFPGLPPGSSRGELSCVSCGRLSTRTGGRRTTVAGRHRGSADCLRRFRSDRPTVCPLGARVNIRCLDRISVVGSSRVAIIGPPATSRRRTGSVTAMPVDTARTAPAGDRRGPARIAYGRPSSSPRQPGTRADSSTGRWRMWALLIARPRSGRRLPVPRPRSHVRSGTASGSR